MAKRRFWAIFFTISLALMGCLQNLALDTKTPRMAKEELKSLLGNPEVIVLDVRIAGGWKKSDWKIKGAIREDPEKIKSWSEKYAKDKTLIFY
jgi:hypothetical protein